MKIESMVAWDDCGQGFAVKVNGETVFEYVTYYEAPEDSGMGRNHADVMSIPQMFGKMYGMGAANGGKAEDIVFEHYEVESMDEFNSWR